MSNIWKLHAFTLATAMGLAYIGCALFDIAFPPYGMLAAFAPHSPWPIYGTPSGFALGFLTFTFAGLVLGAIYGAAWDFWAKRLSRP